MWVPIREVDNSFCGVSSTLIAACVSTSAVRLAWFLHFPLLSRKRDTLIQESWTWVLYYWKWGCRLNPLSTWWAAGETPCCCLVIWLLAVTHEFAVCVFSLHLNLHIVLSLGGMLFNRRSAFIFKQAPPQITDFRWT